MPDLKILDIKMPRLNGLEAAEKIKKRHPEAKIQVLTMLKEEEYFKKAQEIGVDGFVLKEDVDLVLLSAIDAIRAARTFVSPLMGH
jgi:DNA-binding NarL/FixJ family response regulator